MKSEAEIRERLAKLEVVKLMGGLPLGAEGDFERWNCTLSRFCL